VWSLLARRPTSLSPAQSGITIGEVMYLRQNARSFSRRSYRTSRYPVAPRSTMRACSRGSALLAQRIR